MTIKEYCTRLRAEFEQRVSKKTGWGKNELLHEFDEASVAVLLEGMMTEGQEGREK